MPVRLYATPVAQQQRIARNTLYAIVGVLGAGVVRFLFTIVTGRAFGADALGVVAIVVALATIVTIPSAGVGAAGNRFLAVAAGSSDADMRTQTLGATWRGGVVVIAFAVVAAWGYLGVQSVDLSTLTQALGLAFVVAYGLYLTAKGVMFGAGHARIYAAGEVAGFVAFVISIALAAAVASDVGWVLLSQVLWALGVLVAAYVAGIGPRSLRGRAPATYWGFAVTASIGSLLSLGVAQATILVMAALHGTTEAGLLAAAVAITTPLYLLPRSVSLALTPSMAFSVGAGTESEADLETRYTGSLLVVFGTIAVAGILALEPFILSVYGTGFSDAADDLAVLAVASFVVIVGIPVVNRYAAQGTRTLLVTVGASALGAAGAAVAWLTIGADDPIWIAIGFLISAVIKVVLPFVFAKPVLGRWLFPNLALLAIAAVAIALALTTTALAWAVLVISILGAIPIAFVLTIRRRAVLAGDPGEPLRVTVVTNMYPTDDHPYYGIFVARRVASYTALGATVTVVSSARDSGWRKYARLAVRGMRSLLTDPMPDVIEAHPTHPTGVIAAAMAWCVDRPLVVYAHGSDIERPISNPAYRRLVAATISRAAEIHTNSVYLARQIDRQWPGHPPTQVVPPGVEPPATVQSQAERTIDVAFVGTMHDLKGPDTLIRALAAIPAELRTNVVFAGDGPELERYRAMAGELGVGIEFRGRVAPSEAQSIAGSARVLAAPSRREALGLAVVEALAVGTPVVVSDVGGLSAIPDVACGTVVPADDADALRTAITEWLLADDAQWSAAAVAAAAVAARYNEHAIAERALALLTSVAHRATEASPVVRSGPLRTTSID